MASLFSRIIAGELPAHFVFRDERFVAFLDIAPLNPGHVLLVPRAEAAFLADLPGGSVALIGDRLARLTRAIKRALGCPAVNVLLNDGAEAGQIIPHVHFHLVPRDPGEGGLRKLAAGGQPYDADEEAAQALMADYAARIAAAWAHC